MNREWTGDVPLSFAQQRLWFLDQFEPGSVVYNIPAAARLTGPLKVTVLERSLNEIVRRHDVLRATFPTVDGQPYQVICPAVPLRRAQGQLVTLSVVDLRELPEVEREAEARRLTTAEAQQPFDLARGPLVRTAVLQLGDEDHILLLTMHQIVSDSSSTGVLFKELSVLYGAFSTDSPSPLAEPTLQYADFARWQRQWQQGEVFEQQLSYWKQRLGDTLPVLELPSDRPRPTKQTYRGATHSLTLPSCLSESLKTLSRQEGVTLFMTLLSAFHTLLHRYTGQDDIVVGTPIAGRNRVELGGLIGFFVNTLVLRTNLAGNPSFRQLLERVREVVLGAYAHQDLPFEKLVEKLQPERDLSHTPLFQVMFQLSNGPGEPLQLSGLNVDNFEFESGITKCDVTLEVIEKAAGLCCRFEYNTDLFDAATIARMGGHFQTLLEGVVADAGQSIATLPLLTGTERQQLLVEWNTDQVEDDGKDEDGKNMFSHQLFEVQVRRTPDAVAVVFEDEQLTYGELDRHANQLAHHLRAVGVGPDVCVGICMERSPELVVAILGTLKAGGACVPLDPAYPLERLTLMLEDIQAPVIVTQERLLTLLSGYRMQAVCLDTGWERIAQESTELPVSNVTSDNLAFVFYTSGSTGRPKAVLRPHVGRGGQRSWEQKTYRLTEDDRHVLKSPIGFTLLSMEVFWPLLTGARVIIARPGAEQDTAYLVKLIAKHRITIISLVPSLLRVLLEEPGLKNCDCLRHVICFGEPLPTKLQEHFFTRLTAKLSVFYGTTEAPSATFWHCKRDDPQRVVMIGRRLPNRQIYVLGSYLQPVPIGVPGELHIGGRLARGYLNRPELTAEKFISNPFSREPRARLYKTGDLARYLPDGNLEFLGRADQQVKIRGVRVELGEVEAVLAQHAALQEAVVLAWEDESGDTRLAAYVVPDQHPLPSIRELRRFVQERLPHYMVPSAFVLLDALPLTPHGKLDRHALPAPDHDKPEQGKTFVAPRTPVEEEVARIWAEVLGLPQVGIYDDFFELGGHSLKATQIMSRLRDTLQVELPLRTIFEAPTVEGLAGVLTRRQIEEAAPEDVARLVAELEAISDETAQHLLTKETLRNKRS
jgi:amino acid adenylation domain-containing protein